MAVFSFSTKKPTDEELIREIKRYCYANNINFSAIVIALLRDWDEQRRTKV